MVEVPEGVGEEAMKGSVDGGDGIARQDGDGEGVDVVEIRRCEGDGGEERGVGGEVVGGGWRDTRGNRLRTGVSDMSRAAGWGCEGVAGWGAL